MEGGRESSSNTAGEHGRGRGRGRGQGRGRGRGRGDGKRYNGEGKGGGYYGKKPKYADAATLPENATEIQKLFFGYSKELTERQDQRERLIKLSRDVTTASKRVIFTLQRFDGSNKNDVLEQAERQFEPIYRNIMAIAKELTASDPQLHHRAYSPGMQEFIEAATFYWFIKTRTVASLEDVAGMVTDSWAKHSEGDSSDNASLPPFSIHPVDYVLGIGDLTGEMMRACINNASHTSFPSVVCNSMRDIHRGFVALSEVVRDRDFPKKLETMVASLKKVERICFEQKVREGEFPSSPVVS